MDNIQYYVVVDKLTIFNIEDEEKINKVEAEFIDTKLPFSEKIQKYFHIEQVGSEICSFHTQFYGV